jgi:hypothetical protein
MCSNASKEVNSTPKPRASNCQEDAGAVEGGVDAGGVVAGGGLAASAF